MSGLYPGIDPKNSTWMTVTKKVDGKVKKMGMLCISMQVVPREEAGRMNLGFGRNEPNNSPFLPPPSGRMKLSLNPFSVFKQLLGPAICNKILCLCFCVIFIMLMVFAGPMMNMGLQFYLS